MRDQYVVEVDPKRPEKKKACDEHERNYVLPLGKWRRRYSHASPLGQVSVEVHVTAVHIHVLPGDMRRLRGDQKHNHRSDLIRCRHSFLKGNPGRDGFEFRLGVWKFAKPLLV